MRVVDLDFLFKFTVHVNAKRPDRNPSLVVQASDWSTTITVENVPAAEVKDGLPSAEVLVQAEYEFLKWAKNNLEHTIIKWECRFGDSSGPIMSSFRSFLPA